ncbi:uncharacterized protein LOC128995220 isoform X2 [Macrosteles quadrilineatus]|uniref:uncharacterized protein LOC128995220 isoform X2 n=1 Tax=Macrosteles quadrilineatus TaxID=74068 RepID=UPI0023E12569|nr:uncharacterized protein LOC128995220 isoform X2 [Macrosteles quadrilineatus]
MHRSVSRYPKQFLNSDYHITMERGRITEEDQLSPVALVTRDASLLQLPSLQWYQYDRLPDSVYAKNTGFTVLIQASFKDKIPQLSSGPLLGQYNFSHVHFHWGQHNKTGSGHSVDGIRFPLEMHVVHVKKNCTNLGETSGVKDGIAIAVHLFSLSEERNTSLDQLTAVLQFIKKSGCCATLFPSSLAEIVRPFSQDYFSYRGAVPGSFSQQYRIVWLVSRQTLPVSSQQLEQFRNLQDAEGNFIRSNSSKPHPLADRKLYLISPSEKVEQIISSRPAEGVIISLSEELIEIQDAEFKSLVALRDGEVRSCAICPHPNHVRHQAKKHVSYPDRIVEGDTSVEESCVDLGALNESGFEHNYNDEQSKFVFGTKGDSYNLDFRPQDPVISAEKIAYLGNNLVVRKSDPSTEQACVLLTKSADSTPPQTTCGYLGATKECTDVSRPNKTNKSSGMIVCNKNLESLGVDCEDYVKSEVFNNTAFAKKEPPVVLSSFRDAKDKSLKNILHPQESNTESTLFKKSLRKEGKITGSDSDDNKCDKSELFNNAQQSKYFLVKQETELRKPYYKVIGEFYMTPGSKRMFMKQAWQPSEEHMTETSGEYKPEDPNSKPNEKDAVDNKFMLSFPTPSEHVALIGNNTDEDQSININKNNSCNRLKLNSKDKVVLDKSLLSNQDDVKEETPKKYYVTRITPIKSGNCEELEQKNLFYARLLSNREFNEPQNNANKPKDNLPKTLCPKDYMENLDSQLARYIWINNATHFNSKSSSKSTLMVPKSQESIPYHVRCDVGPDASGNSSSKNHKESNNNTTSIHGDLNTSQLNSSKRNNKIKLAISFRSHKGRPDLNAQEQIIKLDQNKCKTNHNTANSDFGISNGDNFPEEVEENTVYKSGQTKKITIKVNTPTYRLQHQPPNINNQASSHHLVTIKKVENPDPFFLRRTPKQPMVEYEVLPTGFHHQVKDEILTEEKTIITYTVTKKSNKYITLDIDQPKESLRDKVNQVSEVKKNNISVHQPKQSFAKEDEKCNNPIATNEFKEANQLRIVLLSNQLEHGKNQSNDLNQSVGKTITEGDGEDTHGLRREKEVVDKNKDGRVTTKYVDTTTSNPSSLSTFTPHQLQNQRPKVLSDIDTQEEPTKDPGVDSFIKEIIVNDMSKEGDIKKVHVTDRSPGCSMEQIVSSKLMKKKSNLTNPDEAMGYAYQPQTDTRLVDEDTFLSTMVDSKVENKNEEVKKSEGFIMTAKESNKLRLDKSENMNTPTSNSEELISHDYGDEEAAGSFCDVTFKSRTKLKLPNSQKVELKSLAEVRFKPYSKSVISNPNRSEAKSFTKAANNQITTKDKFCSTTGLRDDYEPTASESSVKEEDEPVHTNINFSPVAFTKDQTVVTILPHIQFVDHWNRNGDEYAILENNGKNVVATLPEDTTPWPCLRGGSLVDDYMFAELHFHWGHKDCCGAEHIIDKQRHTMEAHFLYIKKEYNSLTEALAQEDGLVIVAVQLKVGGPPHTMLDHLIKGLLSIKEAGQKEKVPVESLFSWINKTVEEAKGYFSYKSTMTSEPPYVEAVTWIIFEQAIIFCCQQSLQFRNLMSQNGEKLLKTCRPTKPLNNRNINYVPL